MWLQADSPSCIPWAVSARTRRRRTAAVERGSSSAGWGERPDSGAAAQKKKRLGESKARVRVTRDGRCVAHLPRLHRDPRLLLHLIDLLPDLRQLRPNTLQILQLLQSHLMNNTTRVTRAGSWRPGAIVLYSRFVKSYLTLWCCSGDVKKKKKILIFLYFVL